MMGRPVLEARTEEKRGRYEILRVVNRGGMGEIALGRVLGTKGFEKLVVLKRLRADAEREDHFQMFDVEQEVMSRIEHPNIVKVFDQPTIDNTSYLAMEYVRGRNLDQVIRAAQQHNEELTLQFTLSAISEVLRGLAFVHRLKDNDGNALGVVHQDMTPSNVMVSFYGEVKITDFGISYVTSRDGGLRKGVLKGKPRYVAPEVLAGKRVNNTADIYGVGVVLYEMLTGRALFARASVKDTLAAVARNELPDLRAELAQHGEGVAIILEKALRKDPADRYQTAELMAADVLNELSKHGGPASPLTIGYIMRRLFRDDPDVPESEDPALEEAAARHSGAGARAALVPVSLDKTLEELDRLLGKDRSVDLFSVPPELEADLAGLADMDPFAAKTPIPDFVWGAKDDNELLARANEAFGMKEPPVLQIGPTSNKEHPPLPSFDSPPRREEPKAGGTYSQIQSRTDHAPPSLDEPLPKKPSTPEVAAPPPVATKTPVPEAPARAVSDPRPAPEARPAPARRTSSNFRAPAAAKESGFKFWLGLILGLTLGVAAAALYGHFFLG